MRLGIYVHVLTIAGTSWTGRIPKESGRSSRTRIKILQRRIRVEDEQTRGVPDPVVEVSSPQRWAGDTNGRSLTCRREAGLTKDKIRKNHRKLQIINHPDRGGSPYLATKVNEAAEYLNKSS